MNKEKCIDDGEYRSSSPNKRFCINCKEGWFLNEEIPICHSPQEKEEWGSGSLTPITEKEETTFDKAKKYADNLSKLANDKMFSPTQVKLEETKHKEDENQICTDCNEENQIDKKCLQKFQEQFPVFIAYTTNEEKVLVDTPEAGIEVVGQLEHCEKRIMAFFFEEIRHQKELSEKRGIRIGEQKICDATQTAYDFGEKQGYSRGQNEAEERIKKEYYKMDLSYNNKENWDKEISKFTIFLQSNKSTEK